MKAQFSLEAMFVVIVILVMFSILILDMISRERISGDMKKFLDRKALCEKISNEIQSVFILGSGSESTIKIEQDVKIAGKTIYIYGVLCDTCCEINANLSEGFVTIKNSGGEIFV